MDQGWHALLRGWKDVEEDGGGAASPTARAGWDGTSICYPSLPEPSVEEAPPCGGSGGGREVSMGDNVGGTTSPTARAGWDGMSILGPSLPETLSLLGWLLAWLAWFGSTLGLPCLPFGLAIGWALSARLDLRLR